MSVLQKKFNITTQCYFVKFRGAKRDETKQIKQISLHSNHRSVLNTFHLQPTHLHTSKLFSSLNISLNFCEETAAHTLATHQVPQAVFRC